MKPERSSYTNPECARITHVRLDLTVEFDKKILQGSAFIYLKRKPSCQKIFLDSYCLVISSVTDFLKRGSELKYEFESGTDTNIESGKSVTKFGNKLIITLPQFVEGPSEKFSDIIEIKYETSPESNALCWISPQTTYTYPFVFSNNKFTYQARAMFPCQDTPSVKYTYYARITVPPIFTVLMSACDIDRYSYSDKTVYTFSQTKEVSSDEVNIIAGVLKDGTHSGIRVWSEMTYFDLVNKALVNKDMRELVENLCEDCPEGECNICVLPPSVSKLEIRYPNLMFISQNRL